jgi:hypothetical protein
MIPSPRFWLMDKAEIVPGFVTAPHSFKCSSATNHFQQMVCVELLAIAANATTNNCHHSDDSANDNGTHDNCAINSNAATNHFQRMKSVDLLAIAANATANDCHHCDDSDNDNSTHDNCANNTNAASDDGTHDNCANNTNAEHRAPF